MVPVRTAIAIDRKRKPETLDSIPTVLFNVSIDLVSLILKHLENLKSHCQWFAANLRI